MSSTVDEKSDTEFSNGEISSGEEKNSCELEKEKEKWIFGGQPLWRIYLNSYVQKGRQKKSDENLDKIDQDAFQEFSSAKKSSEMIDPLYQCFPLNIFNASTQNEPPKESNRDKTMKIWQMMKTNPEIDVDKVEPEVIRKMKLIDSEKWPGTWPCIERDIAGEMRQLKRLEEWKLKGLLPCQYYAEDDLDDSEKPFDDYADHKELGHARVPAVCVDFKKKLLIDRASGENPGLVNGDYILCEFKPVNGESRVYAEVCLRGMKGMHVIELSRERKKTWKFCFYQAVVALLVKTQLRYKYATSINIDYIYNHAWMLFIHIGSLTIANKLHLDDIVVYNYKYNIELNLVHELKDIPKLKNPSWKYSEPSFMRIRQLKRPELMKITEQIGWEKVEYPSEIAVHEETKNIEQWFDQLPHNYRNCIIRSSRFSLAFWCDANFWYLYNPYRCDRYGFWDNKGSACIIKFCSRTALKRHLIILLIRAFAFRPEKASNREQSGPKKGGTIDDTLEKTSVFSVQIYQLIYHAAEIYNLKLLQRKPMKDLKRGLKNLEEHYFDDISGFVPGQLGEHQHDDNDDKDDRDDTLKETSRWFRELKVSWSRIAKAETKALEKPRWHQYDVEEKGKLFSLWGELHPTGEMFAKENRGKQIYACYVVCAGMTRIIAPEYWSSKVLDTIVMCGDRYYTSSRLQSDEQYASKNIISHGSDAGNTLLSKCYRIGELLFEVNVLTAIRGKLYSNVASLWKILDKMFANNHVFGILTCENAKLAVFRFCGSYYMFDVNSIGLLVFNYGAGASYLLRATTFRKLMEVLVLTIGSNECSSFSVSPVDILKIIDVGGSSGNVPNERKDKVGQRQRSLMKDDDYPKRARQ